MFSQNKNNIDSYNYSEYGLIPVPFNEVILQDKFWKPRLITQVETLVPFALDKTINAQIALRQTGNFLSGIKSGIQQKMFQAMIISQEIEVLLLLKKIPSP